jgi:hypothetical protein
MATCLHQPDITKACLSPALGVMVDNLTLSPAGLALLEMLEQQTGVSFEVVHLWLDPVRHSPSGDFAQRMDEPEVAEEVLKALRTGEVRVGQIKGAAFGVFPLRRAREVVGCLVASLRIAGEEASSIAVKAMEEAGAMARGILESDLQMNGQLASTQALTRRLHATLRFLGQLGTYESDRDVMHAVLHAATVWFDLDCRIYSRRPDGRFVLSGALPGVEHAGQPLDAERAAQLVAARRFPPAGELDDLGFSGKKDEVLVLPVGIGEPAWLILLAGSLDNHVELTFSAIARVLTGDLQARELARLERWHTRLTQIPSVTRKTPERALSELLEELLREAGAESARMIVTERGSRRPLVSVGSADSFHEGAAEDSDPTRLVVDVPVSPDVTIELTLAGSTPLGSGAAAAVQTWLKALRPWLGEVSQGGTRGRTVEVDVETAAFERRIQEEVERAKRFNLGLGLVLIGPGESLSQARSAFDMLAAAVRPELRASDLLGRLRTGLMAVLLVHAGAEGADSVTERLSARLSALKPELPGVQLGRAVFSPECASAEDLIARARRHSRTIAPMH